MVETQNSLSFRLKARQNDVTGKMSPFSIVLPRSRNYNSNLLREADGASLLQGGRKVKGASLEEALKKA